MSWPRIENEADLPSPALLLDRGRIAANLRRMVEIAGHPGRLRPHVKTHKLAPIVRMKLDLGITKFKVATMAEAEMCAAEGAPEVLVAYPPVGPAGTRLCALMRKFPATHFATIADNAVAIEGLGEAARAAGVALEVLLDLDCGMGRTGIRPGPAAVELYGLIAKTSGLRPGGLHAYDGHIQDFEPATRKEACDRAFGPVLALREELLRDSLPVPALVAGGAPTFAIHAAHPDRECSPGTTVLWDTGYTEKFPDLEFDMAAALLTRVVSRPAVNRLCLDLGHKAVAAENPLAVRVRIAELPEATAVMHSEEHLVIESPRAGEFSIGQALHAFPRHICPTVALHAEAVVVEEGRVVGTWPIAARARRISV